MLGAKLPRDFFAVGIVVVEEEPLGRVVRAKRRTMDDWGKVITVRHRRIPPRSSARVTAFTLCDASPPKDSRYPSLRFNVNSLRTSFPCARLRHSFVLLLRAGLLREPHRGNPYESISPANDAVRAVTPGRSSSPLRLGRNQRLRRGGQGIENLFYRGD